MGLLIIIVFIIGLSVVLDQRNKNRDSSRSTAWLDIDGGSDGGDGGGGD